MASSEDNARRIKTGASLLANGGTLTSEPCPKCNGVQVRLGDRLVCINCGNETNTSVNTKPKLEQDRAVSTRKSAVLLSVVPLIEEKIVSVASEIRVESDISKQKQKADLLERYLSILERTKNLLE